MILRSIVSSTQYDPHLLHRYRCRWRCLTSPPNGILPLARHINPTKGLLLFEIPLAPQQWPSRLELSSSLINQTIQSLKHRTIAVNAVYDNSVPSSGSGSELTGGFAQGKDEIYPARLIYPDGKVFRFPTFSSSTLDTLEFQARSRHRSDPSSLTEFNSGRGRQAGDGVHEILVCTHGSRDCRCSDRGGPLVDALRGEIERRGLHGRVKVNEIAHVGGHKWV